jgi:hypothetical protein
VGKQSPTYRDFNPTNDSRVTAIKGVADELIEMVRQMTSAGGPQTQRRVAIAVTNIEQGAMWAVKALFSEDAIAGDDGGAKGPDRMSVTLKGKSFPPGDEDADPALEP